MEKDSDLLDYTRTAASSKAQEHSNIHQSRTRVLRILAARTWVNNLCAGYQTRSLHNPTPPTVEGISVIP